MKTQNFGISTVYKQFTYYDFLFPTEWARACENYAGAVRRGARADYKSKRINVCGDAKNDVNPAKAIPADGKYTMIEDGILEGSYYKWECRYD